MGSIPTGQRPFCDLDASSHTEALIPQYEIVTPFPADTADEFCHQAAFGGNTLASIAIRDCPLCYNRRRFTESAFISLISSTYSFYIYYIYSWGA